MVQNGGKRKWNQMKTLELVFIGIKGSVVALNPETGDQVWAQRLGGTDFVNVVLEDERVFATTNGEIFCLDAAKGSVLWHNRLKGYGTGLATIATSESTGSESTTAVAAKRRCDEESAAAAAATAA
jgi:outer membrane protein assembly factor BamB